MLDAPYRTLVRVNSAIWDFELTDADMDAISRLHTGCSLFFSHADPESVRRLKMSFGSQPAKGTGTVLRRRRR